MIITAGKAFTDVLANGIMSSPHGKLIREIPYYQTIIDYPFHNFANRMDNLNYIKAEFMWYLKGDPYDDSICAHASIWETIKQPNGRIFSNYGYYWFVRLNKDRQCGFDYVVDTLLSDSDSRQAYIPMLGQEHTFRDNSDVVCTKGISFRIMDGLLSMHVAMRSSDLTVGASIDWPCFQFLHEMMACELDLPLGQFIFSTDSLHVYERNFEYMNNVVSNIEAPLGGLIEVIDPPAITDVNDLRELKFQSDFGMWLTTTS